jgi:hypothetical protein
MKSVIIASMIASAATFAPVNTKSSSTAFSMSYENELGVVAPTGFLGT